MIGRVTRLAPGKKDALVVDFHYLTSKHDLVRPADLFDSSSDDPEIVDVINELTGKSQGDLPFDMVAVAKQAHQVQAQRKLLRIQVREREIKYRRVVYDPLAVSDCMGFRFKPSSEASYSPASPKQAALLGKLGVANAESLSRRQAGRWLELLLPRMKAGLATVKQVSHMIAQGLDPKTARGMSKRDASEYLSKLWGDRRR
jgi:hypothetical protein